MQNTNLWLAALLFIVLIIGANGVMYVIARGAQRDNNKVNWFQNLNRTASRPWEKEDKALEELRQRVQELNTSAPKDDKE
jgi:uncharacterized protein HemX